ncbi:Thioredoxin, partial [Fragariocoptes setiger]
MPVVTIHDEAQFHTHMANAGGKLVVVDFTAKWCGPCQMIAPVFSRLSDKYPQAVFIKVDVDECDSLTAAHRVTAMPTFIFFRAKSKLATLQGANPQALEA